MSLWFLLLILFLAVTAVVFFVLGKSATTATVKRTRYTVAGLALAATVALVVVGALRGRRNLKGFMEEPYVNDMDFDDFGVNGNAGTDAATLLA